MKRFFSILLFLFSLASYSQNSNYWMQAAGSPNVDENLAIAKDNNNNIITVGYFTNTITFPGLSTLTSTSSGVSDVLIQKTDPFGQLIWAFKAGGMGSDRATAVACDASGNIYITGHYYGSAQFGSFTLNSVSNTQDIFIVKLNSSGTFLWAKSAGGNLAEDPYAINVDASGNVIVTGEFQGTAIFGTQTLTSMLNTSGNSSFDVFTVKYDNTGSFLWVRQGSAKFDDRGLDVGTDASGNIFVCGQFSDTITFNSTHNNQIMNAVFIIKYNSAGQEIWFRKAGATSSIAYGLAVDNNNNVYVTGDYTGNLIFYGTPNNFLYGAFSNRIFLVKYDNSGNYLWGKEDASGSYVSSKDVALNANEEPCIYGEFDCRMDDYSVLAGGTGMFNSVGFHDLFITQYDKLGNRIWTRNFGGPYNDKSHGVVFTNNPTPYVCGSFEYKLFVNSIYSPFNVLTHTPNYSDSWISTQNCNNNNGYYYGTNASGFSDCFIMHGVDNTCAYYDYYYRNGIGCQQNFVGGCIDDYTYNCPDTLKMCGQGNITANPYTGTIGGVGPFYHYQWNTGDTMSYHHVTSSSNYSCVMSTYDGCFTTQDTVYAKINPKPLPPTITDSYSINVNQPPLTHSVNICGGTVTLTGGNLQGCSYQWISYTGGGIVSTSGSSCVVNKTDTFIFILTNSFGCVEKNRIFVKIDTIEHVIPKTNMPDTFKICQGQCINYFIYDSISNPTGIQSYNCFNSLINVITGNSAVTGFPYCVMSNLSLRICPSSTGPINLNIMYIFFSLCGKDTAYFHKPVYIIVNPKPLVAINFTGSNFICPGDSTLLVATFTITPSTNISYTVAPNDSIWAVQQGNYYVSINAIDTVTGCAGNNFSYIYVQTKPNPYIHTIPANGLICPGDSVKIICTYPGAVTWQWHGPAGIIPISASHIYDSIPGFYYCVATDNNGCTLTSNTVEIKKYNASYLLALPQTVACAGQPITLHVVSNDTSLIQWMSPLSGGGTIRNVTAGGTYYCKVTMCGITTTCAITVIISNPVVTISVHGNTVICPGDSVLLTANSGMAGYLWLPTNQLNDSIYAYVSGTYVVIVTDGNGCQATDSISITYNPNTPPHPTTTNDSICAGNVAHLQASTTGNYSIDWYAQQYSGSIINTGTNYTTPPLNQNTNYYVSVMDSVGCHSIRQIANVFIKLTSFMPLIWGDTLLCVGDTLNLYTTVLGGATYSWSGPNSFTSSITNPQISPAAAAASGTYSVIVSGYGCTSPTASHYIAVLNLSVPNILAADSLCQGAALILQGQSLDSNVIYNWTGPNNFSSSNQTNTINPIDSVNAGAYYLQTKSGQCKSQLDTFYVFVKPTPNPSVYALSGSCLGDSVNLFSQTLAWASFVWTGPNGFSSLQANPLIINLDSSKAGYYYFNSTLKGCTGKDSVLVKVNQLPYFNLGNDTTICGSSPLVLDPGHFTNYSWNNGSMDTAFIVYNSEQITLTVSNQYGCKYSDTLNVVVAACLFKAPNVFTPNGDGINDMYYFRFDHYEDLEFIIYDRWGVLVYKNSNNENSWDGYNMFTKKPVTDGTYYYIATAKNMLGVKASDHGFIEVFR